MADPTLATDDFAPIEDEPKSAAGILAALSKAEDAFEFWQATCSTIDQIYSKDGTAWDALNEYQWADADLDLFWASFEIMKEAVYARPPQPVVSPTFKDNRRLLTVTAELLERTTVSTFQRTGIHDVMMLIRDDVLFAGRGVPWVRYEKDKGKRVCIEHVDRTDFRHEPARYWTEVAWVAKRSWLTEKDAIARFGKKKTELLTFHDDQKERDGDKRDKGSPHAPVWEVWHRGNDKTYWVAEGVQEVLDEGKPETELTGFFPCPKPAYGTLRRRSLIPVPDWERYRIHFGKINDLTSRIYLLLDKVRMKGLVPAGGDLGDAIQQAMESDDDQIIIPVPAALVGGVGLADMVVWLPLEQLATTIQGLIEARRQLIDDFYQLSGISDIMRGATEAEETLGAQQLKSQYGSVRIRGKSSEIQRVAADAVKIAAEIIAEKFDKETLLEMAQMEIPSKRDVEKQIADIEKSATDEMQALSEKAQAAAQEQQEGGDPQQAAQQFEQAQQAILAKYAPMLRDAESQVPIEDVMKLLRDDKARGFTFEIASDSTVLVDEMAEKSSRNEFMQILTESLAKLASVVAMGPEAINLWGAGVKFQISPYRVGRDLDAEIDAFIDAAPEIAKRMAQANQGGEAEGLVQAQQALADAEKVKAQAAMAGVQAKSELDKAELQRKIGQMQMDAQAQQSKTAEAMEKLRQSAQDSEAKVAKALADIDHVRAQTYKTLVDAGIAQSQQAMNEFKTVADVEARAADQDMAAQGQAVDAEFRSADLERAERGEERADRQQDFSEQSNDRQMTLAERQSSQDNG